MSCKSVLSPGLPLPTVPTLASSSPFSAIHRAPSAALEGGTLHNRNHRNKQLRRVVSISVCSIYRYTCDISCYIYKYRYSIFMCVCIITQYVYLPILCQCLLQSAFMALATWNPSLKSSMTVLQLSPSFCKQVNWIGHVVQASKRHLDEKLSVKHLFSAFIAKLIISGGLDTWTQALHGPTHKKGFSMLIFVLNCDQDVDSSASGFFQVIFFLPV